LWASMMLSITACQRKKESGNNQKIEKRDHNFQICMLISCHILLLNKMFMISSLNMDLSSLCFSKNHTQMYLLWTWILIHARH
jgi:hypothetical protein